MSEQILSIGGLKIRYFAYNCLEIKLPTGKTLVVDPCLRKEGQFSCGYDVSVLEGADYVFCNHCHEDHVASLGDVYDRFHPVILAHAATTYTLARVYDIPYIRFIPFTAGDEFDFDDFALKVIAGRHNNYVPGNFMIRPSGRKDELCPASSASPSTTTTPSSSSRPTSAPCSAATSSCAPKTTSASAFTPATPAWSSRRTATSGRTSTPT